MGRDLSISPKGAIKASLGGCTSPDGRHEILADLRHEGPTHGARAVGTCHPSGSSRDPISHLVCRAVGEEEGQHIGYEVWSRSG